jgi:tetratricopeptide (TPR) repeat protein
LLKKRKNDVLIFLKELMMKRTITCLLMWTIMLTAAMEIVAQDKKKAQPLKGSNALAKNQALAEEAYGKGIERQAAGDIDGAIADYTRALELDPYYPDAFNNRANARMTKGDLSGAVADFTEAIRYRPESDEGYYNRGLAYLTQENYQAALADFSRSIEIKPQAIAYNNRGTVYRALNKTKEAIADYTKAVEAMPLADAYYNRGAAYEDLLDYKSALADYTRAIELNENFARSYANRGMILLQQNKDADAQRDFAKGIQLDESLRTEIEKYVKATRASRPARKRS